MYEYIDTNNIQQRVGNGMHLRRGIAKGVKVIRNDGAPRNGNGGPKAALVLDSKILNLPNLISIHLQQKLEHSLSLKNWSTPFWRYCLFLNDNLI